MFTVISPAKRLHEGPAIEALSHTQPYWPEESAQLIDALKPLDEGSLSKLMGISDALAELNRDRYQRWLPTPEPSLARQAALTFAGDTYVGLDAESLSDSELEFAQGTLGILSGLYGLLRPLDLVQPYRLEMGTSLKNSRGKNLYEFWGTKIAEKITEAISDHAYPVVINLASAEYFKAISPKTFPHRVITPIFKEVKSGKAKVVSFVAKRARGAMARHIVQQRIQEPEHLKSYTGMGYTFQPEDSTDNEWVYTRPSGTPN